MLLLRRTMNQRIGRTGLPVDYVAQLWTSAVCGAAVAWAVKIVVPPPNPIIAAVLILGPYGGVFFATAFALGIPEASRALARVKAWVPRA